MALLSQNSVADLTSEIALTAADLSKEHKIGMADSIVLAHAQHVGGTLVTLDNDFSGMPGARVIRKVRA